MVAQSTRLLVGQTHRFFGRCIGHDKGLVSIQDLDLPKHAFERKLRRSTVRRLVSFPENLKDAPNAYSECALLLADFKDTPLLSFMSFGIP